MDINSLSMCKYVHMLNWDDLRYVLAVARSGNLAAAARHLQVGHTTVGRRLNAIESELGTRLFVRTRTEYQATLAGQRLVAEANEIEARLDAVTLDISGQDQRMAGGVCISATGTFIDAFIVPEITEFRRRHQHIELSFSADSSVKDLRRREADIGIRSVKPVAPYLIVRPLCVIATAPYASADYLERNGAPSPRRQFAGHTLVRFPAVWKKEEEWFDHCAGAAETVARFDRGSSAIAAIRAGLGIGLLECFIGDRDASLVRVIRTPVLRESWWLTIHEDMRGNARVRAASHFLVERTQARRLELEGTPRQIGP